MSPKTGRPKSDNPKKHLVTIRLTDDELNMLDKCSQALDVTRTELIRDQIKKVYATLEKK